MTTREKQQAPPGVVYYLKSSASMMNEGKVGNLALMYEIPVLIIRFYF